MLFKRPIARLSALQPDVVHRLYFHCFPLLFALFFHCYPLFLHRRPFSCPRKALHCRQLAFPIADRLYFFQARLRRDGCDRDRLATRRLKAQDRQGDRSDWVCSARSAKTVVSKSILQVMIVLTGRPFSSIGVRFSRARLCRPPVPGAKRQATVKSELTGRFQNSASPASKSARHRLSHMQVSVRRADARNVEGRSPCRCSFGCCNSPFRA